MRAKGISACLLALLLALPASRPAAGTLMLAPADDAIDLSPHLHWQFDAEGRLSVDQAFALARSGDAFAPLEGDLTFGFRDGAFWFHASLRNAGHPEERWLLLLEYALLDEIDVWLRYPDGRKVHYRSGDLVPFSNRAIGYRHPNFQIELPGGSGAELLVRARSESSVQVPLRLLTPARFAAEMRDAQFGHGVYFGTLLALLLYNLILWLALRDASHFWFCLHAAGVGLVLFCLYGFGFQMLWPDAPQLANLMIPLSMNLGLLATHEFARRFLDQPRQWRLGNSLSVAFVLFHAALTVLSFVIDYRTSVLISTASVFPGAALIVSQAMVTARRGYRPAWVFLIALVTVLAGMIVYASVSFDILPKTFLTEYGFQIGSAIEMLLFSVALAHRYAELRDENARIVRETNLQLERSVAARTRELSAALEQLAAANGRLREANRRDSLTGLFNRPHFLQVLARMLEDARSSLLPIAVLMIDVDHFKRINDTMGHPVGDACLHRVAQCVEDALARHGGVVARFGGEEFAAALPGLDLPQAARAAESLRERIASDSFLLDGREIRLTISVGLQVWLPEETAVPEEVLRRADEALYAAKRDGRNRVRTSAPR